MSVVDAARWSVHGAAVNGCERNHGRIDGGDYETIFRTPHGVDLAGLDGLAGVRVTVVGDEDDLAATLQAATATTEPGVDLVIARIDPDHDMAVRRQVRAAVGEAIGA